MLLVVRHRSLHKICCICYAIQILNTHTNQSIAQSRDTSCTGASIAESTISISTSAALGTEALAMLAAVEVRLGKKAEK